MSGGSSAGTHQDHSVVAAEKTDQPETDHATLIWPRSSGAVAPSILIVDGDFTARRAIAAYLRDCGYMIVEAGDTDEALVMLAEPSRSIDVILCDMAAIGTSSALELASWVGQHRPDLEVRLAGSVAIAADTAAELCESGPHLARPYDPQAVVNYIERLRGIRERAESVQPDPE